MRFIENGPSLPDELLEERDNGNVVFFCGAGVSRPAGLPGFFNLAKLVMDALGTPANARSKMFLERAKGDPDQAPPIDQVFSLLQREYGAGHIEDVVAKLLRARPKANISQQKTILRLPRGANRNPQVVTTNFDLLFERVERSIKKYEPPALPDLASGQPLEGLVYLHGRLPPKPSLGGPRRGLVLSSSDFGRAYFGLHPVPKTPS